MPVEPGPQGRKAAIGGTEHAHSGVGIEELAARSLVPFVHPDHRQRPVGTCRGFHDRRRTGAARRGMRENHRHYQCAETRIVEKRIETKSERLGCLQHFSGEIGGIGDRAKIRNHRMQRGGGLCFKLWQQHAMRFGLVGANYGGTAGGREDSDAPSAGRGLRVGKERSGLQHGFEIVDRDRAGFLERGLIGNDRPDHRSRMRHRRLARGLAVAGLVDYQRLARVARFSRGAEKAVAILHALEQADDRPCIVILGEIGDEIADIDVAGIAGREVVRKSDPTLHALQHGVAQRAAL